MSSTDNPLGDAPAEDATLEGRAMQDELAARLFGESPELAQIGRFTILRKLGAGAMGAVYAARDPELEREVAVKVLRPSGVEEAEVSAARMRREAKTLARLSHPNAVAIHEVGEDAGRVFVAMELVHGVTLAEWARAHPPVDPHRTLEAMRLLVQAGRGLVAAHAVGLVHRDVKPANILVGDDQRVRVADFGLALPRLEIESTTDGGGEAVTLTTLPGSRVAVALTSTGRVVGTPAYMAPEQFDARDVDANADQFAFAVTAWEVLLGARPFIGDTLYELRASIARNEPVLPPDAPPIERAVRRALSRALCEDPKRRFPSMVPLLKVLEAHADPGRRRRRRFIGGAAGAGATAILAAYAVGEADRSCDAAQALAGVWDEARRADVHAAFLATDASFADQAWAEVETALDAYADRWATVYREGCQAGDARARCLQDRRRELTALVDVLAEADADVLAHSDTAIASLPSPVRCGDLVGDISQIPPPSDPALAASVAEVRDDLARVHSLHVSGRIADALALAQAAASMSEELGYLPLQVQARVRVASLRDAAGEYRAAADELERAYFAAQALGDDETAAEAALELASTVGASLARTDEGLAWVEHSRAAAARLARPDPNEEARRYMMEGMLRQARSEFELSLEAFDHAAELYGDEHALAYTVLSEVGETHMFSGDGSKARGVLEEALQLCRSRKGRTHPSCASILHALGQVEVDAADYDSAGQRFDEALSIQIAARGPDHPIVATMLFTIGDYKRAIGKPAEAMVDLERAREIQVQRLGADHPDTGRTLVAIGILHIMQGRYAESIVPLRRAQEALEGAFGPRARDVAAVHGNIAIAFGALHRYSEARAHYEQALSISRELYGPDHSIVAGVLGNLGLLAAEEKKFHEAFDYHSRALEIELARRGPDHPNVATFYTNLGVAEAGRGRHLEALGYQQKALPILVKAHGDGHPMVGTVLANMGWAYVELKDDEAAAEHFRRALEVYEAAGYDEVAQAPLRFELAKALRKLGRDPKEARAQAEQARTAYQGVAVSDYAETVKVEVEKIDAWLAQ